jgi:hypothetical protein
MANGNTENSKGKSNVNGFSPRRHGDTENGENQENNNQYLGTALSSTGHAGAGRVPRLSLFLCVSVSLW